MSERTDKDKDGTGGEEDGELGVHVYDEPLSPERKREEIIQHSPNDETGRCCMSSCSFCKASIVVLHIVILVSAILCMIPMGVMTSVIRSYLAGIATFVWLAYCCAMVASNIVAMFFLRRDREKNDESGAANTNEDGEEASPVMSDSCNQIGCLCVMRSSTTTSFKMPCPTLVTLLLVVEGILLLMPVFASISSHRALNDGAVDAAFAGASTSSSAPLASDPRAAAFSFGQYMLPGAFSYMGGYTNNDDAERGRKMTLKYKDGCEPECELDIHTPDSGIAGIQYPVIFHVHGGGWDYGDKSAPLVPIGYWLARNYAFVSVQYRFPSQTPGGATVFEQLDDVQNAFEYVMSVGADSGLDASRVLFFGDSAGGHLACTVAYRLGVPGIRGVMNLYGATEWKFYMDSGGGSLESLLERVLPSESASEDDYADASCSTYATPESPPVLTMHGTWDTLVPLRVSEHFHSVLGSLGVPNLLVEVPLAEHVLEAGFYSNGCQMTVYAMERFVAARLA